MPSWLTRRLRGLAVLGLIVLGVVAFLGFLAWRPWDARMGAAEAAPALAEEVGGGPYSCQRQEGDDTIELDDVDYVCVEEGPEGRGYWIGTDGDKITEVLPAG
ncbi:MAG TPA: hypothetical protein VD769_08565 [Gaiellaceae bacterium]|nr:hypothetical protein [Gaiellaceae bacterium]